MAHRTVAGAPFPLPLLLLAMFDPRPVSQPIERETVPTRARRLRHRAAERRVDPPVALEPAIWSDVDDDVLALIAADERRPRQRQPRVERRLQARFHGPAVVDWFPQEVL